MWWAWGQFMDHDMTLTAIAVPMEAFNIPGFLQRGSVI